jgi:very-short-patch-repair endonuclease
MELPSSKTYAKALPRARRLRRLETEVEKILWRLIRARQLEGRKFRRQVPIGPYVADFF